MARLALVLAGAVIGSFFGMPQIGILVGSLLGAILFPEKGPTVTGPRLTDLGVQSAAYGTSIPYGGGTMRQGGQMIWARPIKEVMHKQKSGGKGGKSGGGSMITYTYFGNFAVSFGEGVGTSGQVAQIVALWFDGNKIMDIRSNLKTNIKFRFYPGDETQLPDSLMVADKGALTPGYRGQAYMVYEDLPLGPYGNRIPIINALISFNTSIGANIENINFAAGGKEYASVFNGSGSVTDWANKKIYVLSSVIPGTILSVFPTAVLYTMSIDSRAESLRKVVKMNFSPLTEVAAMGGLMPDGTLAIATIQGDSAPTVDTTTKVLRVQPTTGKILNSFGSTSNSLTNTSTHFGFFTSVVPVKQLTGGNTYALVLNTSGWWGVLKWGAAITVASIGTDVSTTGDRAMPACPGKKGSNFGQAYFISNDNKLRRVNVTNTGTVTQTVVFDFDVSESLPGFAANECEALWYDPVDDSVIAAFNLLGGTDAALIKVRDVSGTWTKIWRDNATYAGKTFHYDSGTSAQSIASGGILGFTVNSGLVDEGYQINTSDGSVIIHDNSTQFPPSLTSPAWNSATKQAVYADSNDPMAPLKLVTFGVFAPGNEFVADVIKKIALKCNFLLTDIDVTAITTTVTGWSVRRQTSAREVLASFAQPFFFDAVESDFKIKFIPRDGIEVLTIPEDDLIRLNSDTAQVVEETRLDELTLPQTLNLVFMDKDNDYQTGTIQQKRIKSPNPTMYSDNTASLEIPLALSATEARTIVERLLYQTWVERTAISFKTSWRYLRRDPGDCVFVQRNDGVLYSVRMTKLTFAPDGTLKWDGMLTDQVAYSATGVAGGAGSLPQNVPPLNESILFLPDLPLMRDLDAVMEIGGTVIYILSTGVSTPWSGDSVQFSIDGGADYIEATQQSAIVQHGFDVSVDPDTLEDVAFPAPESPFHLDHINTLTVALSNDTLGLESITDAQLLAGENTFIIGTDENGYEVCSFRDAVQDIDGNWVLSTFMRGLRGTEYLCGSHETGDQFIMLDPNAVDVYTANLTTINAPILWKPVGFGQAIADVDAVTRTHTGNDLKPRSPVHLKATDDGGGNIVFTWVRRTRIGGAWMDGVGDVPLSEASELYDFRLLSLDGLTVYQEELDLTSPTFTILKTDVLTFYGTTPLPKLRFAVYQKSQLVGRGHVGDETLVVDFS